MSSWGDATSRYDKELADKQQREAEAQAQRERAHAARLKEVAKVEPLVQDFLRSARSVGNPDAKGVTYEEVGLFFKKRIPKGVGYWVADFNLRANESDDKLIVRANGLWTYGEIRRDYHGGGGPWGFEIGRKAEGLFCEYHDGNIAAAIDAVQRQLVRIMREHGIPIPS